jgi:alkaline phosphatase
VIISCSNLIFAAPPKNVIFCIGDGMGFEQVKAAGMYATGEPNTISFESFSYRAQVTTHPAISPLPDSASAATAIATGMKVFNGVVSMAIPGDFSELETILERAQSQQKSVGLVTTTHISHATPACFASHEITRENYYGIILDYLTQTKPNVLFGGAKYISEPWASDAGYTVVTDQASLYALNTISISYVSGQFGPDSLPFEYDGLGSLPHLSEMTAVALDILDNEPNGFFLMVEGGRIDSAGHSNNIQRNVFETLEFANAVQEVIDWAAGRTDTLILVTADHETGGLFVSENNGQGYFPTVTWSTDSHTDANVGAYAWGVNAELVSGSLDNTDFFAIATINEVGFPDYDADNDVDVLDLAAFVMRWCETDCQFPYYCDGVDLDLSGKVDLKDFVIFAAQWHSCKLDPPEVCWE